MEKFKDVEGNEWAIRVTIGTCKEIRDRLGIDLLSGKESESWLAVAGDFYNLLNVLFVLCEKQADERGINSEQFAHLLFGDELQDAAEAFVKESINFIPSRERREMAKESWKKVTELENIARSIISKETEGRMEEIRTEAGRLLSGTAESSDSNQQTT